jgi:two-component system C4-dicarboxylate transport response regulator DctD
LAEKKRILIVDDDHLLCKNLEEHLEFNGYVPSCAFSGIEALRVFKLKEFHLVLTDLQMPHIDGFELIERIRRIKSEIPVILMTGHGDTSIKDKAFKLGVSGYVNKPFNTDHMVQLIQRVLNDG